MKSEIRIYITTPYKYITSYHEKDPSNLEVVGMAHSRPMSSFGECEEADEERPNKRGVLA